ncbi:MAG: Periplasmic binding protein domain [Acidimicrobiaceae bacterium]|jgi:ABC-type sugar transport system substrate-binding protein|nr:Periplasmic binding protein domain [Acidimicrobiaceae bacterium]
MEVDANSTRKAPSRRTRRRRRLNGSIVAITGALALTTVGVAPWASASSTRVAQPAKSTAGAAVSLKGLKVLVVPYWLDPFGAAWSYWITKIYKSLGVSVTTYNPNAVRSAQLDELSTAATSHVYAGVIWEPVDPSTDAVTIEQIQKAGIPQVIFGADITSKTVKVTQLSEDDYNSYYQSGEIAAKYIKAHPSLGSKPEAAFISSDPVNPSCNKRINGMMAGLRKISPNAQLVFNGPAASEGAAATKMSNFITTGKPFNVFAACGSNSVLGGISAMKAGGLAGATNKVPQHVFILSNDASPPELADMWSKSSAVMATSYLAPSLAAQAAISLLDKVITHKLAINASVNAPFGWLTATANCQQFHKSIVQEFGQVPGFSIPSCSFKYAGTALTP